MPRSGALLIYLMLFVAAAITAGLGARFGDWAMQVAACKMHREPGTFRAYCMSPYYGAYEQGAYWLDLEPAAIAHLKKAEVLFLGNSRAQFGFSTDKIRDYFGARGIPFYVMGFSYGESSYFAIALIEKYHLKPKLVVIDADPFFNTGFSDPAKELFDESGSEIDHALRRVRLDWDYQRRRAFNHLQPALCAAFPRLCSGAFKSIYRSEANGLSWLGRSFYLNVNRFFQPPLIGLLLVDRKCLSSPIEILEISLNLRPCKRDKSAVADSHTPRVIQGDGLGGRIIANDRVGVIGHYAICRTACFRGEADCLSGVKRSDERRQTIGSCRRRKCRSGLPSDFSNGVEDERSNNHAIRVLTVEHFGVLGKGLFCQSHPQFVSHARIARGEH